MEIFMFMMFFVCNMFVILVMNFALDSNYRYNGGMYLGVHIPSEHCNDEEVTALVTAGRKAMKKYNLINGIVSTLLCFVCFVNIAVFTLIYLVWIFAYIGGEQFIEISSHRKMYALKMKNGWIVEAQKRKRYVDTKVSADAGNTHIKGWIHILLAVIQTGLFIPFLTDTGSLIFEMMLAIYLCTLLISLIAIISHYAVGRIEKNIYSTDSELNLKINVTKKKYMCISFLVMNVVNTLAWGYFAISEAIAGTVVTSSVFVYIFIEMLAAFAVIIPLFYMKSTMNESLSATDIEFIDDDEYWKYGFYYNPDDSRTLVPNRMQSASHSFNYARTSSKIISGFLALIIAGSIIFSAVVMIPFINVKVDIALDDTQLIVSSAGYTSKLNISEITEIELMDELPSDSFTKLNGGATDEYLVGVFKGYTYGRCSLYICEGDAPILMIKTDSQTVFFNSSVDGQVREIFEKLAK